VCWRARFKLRVARSSFLCVCVFVARSGLRVGIVG
jgi:hypothetical protein